jgi:biopolymer transport protein ExbB/TolQ
MEDIRMTNQKCLRILSMVLSIFILTGYGTNSIAQDSYRLYITDIAREYQKDFLGVPTLVTCKIYWKVYQDRYDEEIPVEISALDEYRLRYVAQKRNRFHTEWESPSLKNDGYVLSDLPVGQRYGFTLEGYRDGKLLALSDTSWIVTGKLRADMSPPQQDEVSGSLGLPFSGRFPMALMGKGYVFDGATNEGKLAFHLIWYFFLLGLIIMVFCWWYLRLGNVFPMKHMLLNLGLGVTAAYRRNVRKAFDAGDTGGAGIVQEWRKLLANAKEKMWDYFEKESPRTIEDIQMKNIEFWHDVGARKVKELKNRIKIEGFDHSPSGKIILAGLENHEHGGFRWMEVSKEIDRAIENRATLEIEKLRRKSFMDWLWNFGTLAPLLGLFGTATGISHAFSTMKDQPLNSDQVAIARDLAGGIFEALWTTIFGLVVAILLMLFYYFYQNKLNRIFSKWEEIYLKISEPL